MNIDLIEDRVMWAISNAIFYTYGNIGYYVELLEDTKEFNVKIFDMKCRELDRLTDEEKEEHLLNNITVNFGHMDSDNNYEIVDYIVVEIEKILYQSDK